MPMTYDVAAERGSQPAQRDELAHSQTVPIGDGVLFTSHYRYLTTRGLRGGIPEVW